MSSETLGRARPEKDVKLTENLTGGSSLVMAIFHVCVSLCAPFAVGSYLIHILKILFCR